MVKRRRKEEDISQIDSGSEVVAYGIKKIFGTLGSWKQTLRLAVLLVASISAAVAVKYLIKVLQ